MTTTNNIDRGGQPGVRRKVGLYIHLPFCERKCNYCSFPSMEGRSDQTRTRYLDNLLREIRLRRDWLANPQADDPLLQVAGCVVDSIFIGGGTPSLFEGGEIGGLLDAIRDSWQMDEQVEITLESNPNSLSPFKLTEYKRAGVNRLSIGIQSFDDGLLTMLGRLHDARAGEQAVHMAKEAGFENINLDLMFGLPGQTTEQWMASLEQAVCLSPTHLSLYTLQLEEGTRLYQAYKEEKLPKLDDSMDRACYHNAIAYLDRHGYNRYEISNFAREGHQCRHNLKYWSMGDFLGFGLSATSYFRGVRWSNQSSLEGWYGLLEESLPPVDRGTEKKDTRKDEMGIFMFTGLRKTQGISLLEFEGRFGEKFFDAYGECMGRLAGYRQQGLLDWSDADSGNLWLTEAGIDVSNQIMAEFV